MKPPRDRRQRAERRPPVPLDPATLGILAMGYAARYATTAAKLERYLRRKLQERGWCDAATPPDLAAVIERMVALNYVDDRLWGAARARGMTAKGLGRSRVAQDLHAAGVGRDDAAAVLDLPDEERVPAALAAAVTFARRRRLGPFASDPAAARDPDVRRRALAAMARAGHGFDVARQVLAAPSREAAEALAEEA